MASKILFVTGLAFLVLAAMFLAIPGRMMALVDIPLDTPAATTEIRGIYGGLQAGVGVFLLWCCIVPARVRMGLFAAFLLMAGAAMGRTIGIVADPGVGLTIWLLLSVELAGAALCLVGLIVGNADPSALRPINNPDEGNAA